MTYPRRLTAQLLDTDADTVITNALDAGFGISGMAELSGYGFGEISVPYSDPNVLQLRRGRYVQILSAGSAIFTFKIGGAPRLQQVGEGDEFNQFYTVSGQGWGSMFEEFALGPDPSIPAGTKLDYSYRWFSFATPAFPNAGSWQPATELYEYLDFDEAATRGRVEGIEDTGADPDDPGDDELKLYVSPIGFPWPNAPKNGNGFAPTPTYEPTYWIIADGAAEDDVGWHLFRHPGVVLAGDQQLSIFVTADNLFTLFLNGIPILAEDDDLMMWQGWKPVTLTLPAGTHYFAAAVQNVDVPSLDFNPGAFLFDAVAVSVYPGDVETSLTLLLAASDSSWDSAFTADEWPGWSAGDIVLQLLSEAFAEGCLAQFDAIGTTTFTGSADSDSNAWDTEDTVTSLSTIPSIAFRISDTLGDVLRQLRDMGWAEWYFRGDTLTLDMWTPGMVGSTPGVTFAIGTNLLSLQHSETKPYANRLIVQFYDDFVTVNDTGEQTAYGSVVKDYYQADVRTPEDAQRQGRIELARRAQDEQVSSLLKIEPTSTTDCPFEGFGVGDYVSIPQTDGTGTDSKQVHAIHFETDEDGWARWELEVGARWRAPQLEYAELLRNLGGKVTGSPLNHGVPRD